MKIFRIAFLFLMAMIYFSCSTGRKTPALDNEKNPQYQYEKAAIAMNYGLPDEALRYLEEALALDPGHALSLRLLGLVHLEKKNPARAAQAFEVWARIASGYPEAHLYLGQAYQEMGRSDEAEEEFRKSFDIDGNAAAAFRLARLYFARQDLVKALESVEAAVQKSSGDVEVHNLKGVILNQMGRYADAIASFEAASALAPNDSALIVNLGISCVNAGELERARGLFKKALPLLKDQALRNKVQEYLEIIDKVIK